MGKTMIFFHTPAENERIKGLKNLSLFRELSTKELLEVEELLHERNYEAGEIIFDEGDPGLGLFLVVKGRAQVTPPGGHRQKVLLEIGPGEFFGEFALFDQATRSARVTAAEKTRVVALFRAEFFTLLQKNPKIAAKILFELARTISRRARQLLANDPATDI